MNYTQFKIRMRAVISMKQSGNEIMASEDKQKIRVDVEDIFAGFSYVLEGQSTQITIPHQTLRNLNGEIFHLRCVSQICIRPSKNYFGTMPFAAAKLQSNIRWHYQKPEEYVRDSTMCFYQSGAVTVILPKDYESYIISKQNMIVTMEIIFTLDTEDTTGGMLSETGYDFGI